MFARIGTSEQLPNDLLVYVWINVLSSALQVMYDASGVRLHASQQAQVSKLVNSCCIEPAKTNTIRTMHQMQWVLSQGFQDA